MRRTLEAISRSWWTFFVRGLAALAFGIAFIASPGRSLSSLVLFYGIYAVVDGSLAASSGIMAGLRRERWGFLVVSGLAGIVVGFVTLAWPAITAMMLLYM